MRQAELDYRLLLEALQATDTASVMTESEKRYQMEVCLLYVGVANSDVLRVQNARSRAEIGTPSASSMASLPFGVDESVSSALNSFQSVDKAMNTYAELVKSPIDKL